MALLPAVVHATSNNHSLTVKYTVGDSTDEQIASLEKIGDSKDQGNTQGEVFLASLPNGAKVVSCTSDSTSKTLWRYFYSWDNNQSTFMQWSLKYNQFTPEKSIDNEKFTDFCTQLQSREECAFDYVEGKENAIKTQNVTGVVIELLDKFEVWDDDEEEYINKKDPDELDYIFVQISTEGTAPVNKDALLELINSVPTSGYHTENDTWNGKDESTNGFWADMQAIKAEMQNAYEDDSLTQAQVDTKVASFAESLAIAKSKLIKEENVNASALYKTTKGIESTTWNQDNYSEGSWQRFTEAREVATNLIADLYNAEDGKPTEANGTSIKQSDVDAANDLLVAAKNDLLEKDVKKILPRWLNVAGWVLEQDPKEAKYTSDSFASWSSAKEAVSTYVQQGEEEILRSKTNYRNFMNSVVDAVTKFYALEESAESITVHVRVVDNYGMKYPQYAIEDKRTSAFDGDIILSQNKTLQGLFGEEGKLDTAPKELTDYEENQLPDL